MSCKPGVPWGQCAEEEAGGIIIFESWIRQACTVGDEPLTLVGWSACCILHLTLGLGLSSRGCAHPCGSRGAYGPPSPPVPFPARRPPRCTGRSILGANSGGHRSLLRRGTLARPRCAPPRSLGHFLPRRCELEHACVPAIRKINGRLEISSPTVGPTRKGEKKGKGQRKVGSGRASGP